MEVKAKKKEYLKEYRLKNREKIREYENTLSQEKYREKRHAVKKIKEMVPDLEIVNDPKEQEPTQDIIEESIESTPVDTPTEDTDDYGYDYDTSSQKLIDDSTDVNEIDDIEETDDEE